MRPTTSSRVSAMSRISRPTSPVKARPTRGGVCGNHLRTSIEEASRRSRASKDKVSGPGSVGHGALAQRASFHRLGRKVFDVDRLDRIVTAPVDGEAPQRPGMLLSSRSPTPKTRVGLMMA